VRDGAGGFDRVAGIGMVVTRGRRSFDALGIGLACLLLFRFIMSRANSLDKNAIKIKRR
jgi:hypothetical protein